jgi:hypothetical protein
MTDQEKLILQKIKDSEEEQVIARRTMARLELELIKAETKLIEVNLQTERLYEELRVYRNTSPVQPPSLHELEIERFRKDNPAVVAFAKERDEKRGKE